MALVFPLILGLFSLAYGVLMMEEYDGSYPLTRDKGEAIAPPTATPRLPDPSRRPAWRSAPCSAAVPMFRGLAWLGLLWLLGTGAWSAFSLSYVSFSGAGREPIRRDPGSIRCSVPFKGSSSGKGRSPSCGFAVAILRRRRPIPAMGLEVGDNVPGSSYVRAGHPWNSMFPVDGREVHGALSASGLREGKGRGRMLDPRQLTRLGIWAAILGSRAGRGTASPLI